MNIKEINSKKLFKEFEIQIPYEDIDDSINDKHILICWDIVFLYICTDEIFLKKSIIFFEYFSAVF